MIDSINSMIEESIKVKEYVKENLKKDIQKSAEIIINSYIPRFNITSRAS